MSASIARLKNKVVTVATAGTPVQVFPTAASGRIVYLNIQAPAANTGSIFVGPASATTSASLAFGIAKGADKDFRADGLLLDTSALWVDAATSGDKAVITYLEISN